MNRTETTYQDDVLVRDVQLQVEWNPGRSIGDCTRAIRIGSDEIDGDGKVDSPDEIGQEEASTGGYSDENRRIWVAGELRGNLGSKLSHPLSDYFGAEKHLLYVLI